MNDKEIKEHIASGSILIRGIFEMAGNPREHVEKTLKDYINAIKEDPSYIFMNEYFADCEENEGVWSTFYESEILVSDFTKLNQLCFNLGPASIEVIQPAEFKFTDKQINDIYNDVISKLHEVGIVVKSTQSENELLKVNLNRSIRNCVLLALETPRDIKEIAEKVGIDEEHLDPFIQAMVREKRIVKEEEKYKRIGN